MTARANSLTGRVTEANAGTPAAVTLPAHDLRVFLDGFGRLGYDVDGLLAAARLHDVDFRSPDARVPCEAFAAVLARAQQERFTPNLTLALASVTPLGAWPLIDYLVLTSDTVGAGIRQFARYLRITGAPISIDIRDDVEPIRVEMMGAAAVFAIEFDAALMILHFRNEAVGPFTAALSFRHTLDDRAGFERALGCPVTANALWSGISISAAAWQLPLRRRDPVLRQVLEGHANDILARLPARTGFALEVQRVLTPRVAGGDTRIESICREFAMSSRTLQRRLAEEGVSYQKLLDETRKAAAGRYVTESTLAICEIAYLLGYSEPAPFHRAFKRWFGRTADALRAERRSR